MRMSRIVRELILGEMDKSKRRLDKAASVAGDLSRPSSPRDDVMYELGMQKGLKISEIIIETVDEYE